MVNPTPPSVAQHRVARQVRERFVHALDAVIIDEMVGQNNIATMPQSGITELEIAFEPEDYAVCVQKGQTELLAKLDAAIEELKANGTMQELLVKHQLVAAE